MSDSGARVCEHGHALEGDVLAQQCVAGIAQALCAVRSERQSIPLDGGGAVHLDVLVREHYARGKAGQPVESIKSYREADDPLTTPSDEVECVPDRVPENDADRVPTASPQEPLNHASFEGASQRVPTASQSASNDRVPRSGFPYGKHTSASPAENEPATPPQTDNDNPF